MGKQTPYLTCVNCGEEGTVDKFRFDRETQEYICRKCGNPGMSSGFAPDLCEMCGKRTKEPGSGFCSRCLETLARTDA